VHVALLGPLEVRTDGDPGEIVEVAGARLRALLIMLALRPGQLVPASQLIDGLWADQAPAGAANALQALVSRLRRALPEAVIESRPAGYQLELDPGGTSMRFSVASSRESPHRGRIPRRARHPAGPAWRGSGPPSSCPRRSGPAGRTPSRCGPRGRSRPAPESPRTA
jgi:hypothetical protein